MSEQLPEAGVSRAEFDELSRGMNELREALDGLAKARTVDDKRDAQQDVREAKADLDDLAREMGISPKALKAATERARSDERREWIKPILLELLDEELADDLDDLGDAAGDAAAAAGVKGEPAPAKDDDGPTVEHWSDKGIGALLGR